MPGHTDVPIQVGVAVMHRDAIAPEGLFRSYIHTDRPVTWQASRVHGIRKSDLRGAPAMADLWDPLHSLLHGRVIVSHHASTEKRYLGLFPLHPFGPWVDTLEVSRRLYPGLEDYTLGGLLRLFRIEDELQHLCPDWQYHDACYDAAGALILLRFMVEQANLWSAPLEMLLDLSSGRG